MFWDCYAYTLYATFIMVLLLSILIVNACTIRVLPVNGNITVYGTIALSVYKIDYSLRCLEYICSVSSP